MDAGHGYDGTGIFGGVDEQSLVSVNLSAMYKRANKSNTILTMAAHWLSFDY